MIRSLAAVALLGLACSTPPPPPEAPPEAEPEVRVLELGAAPRSLLRPLPAEAGLETRELTLTMTGEQVQAGMTGLMNAPPVSLTLELERSAPEGHRVSVQVTGSPFSVSEAELVDPNVLVAMQAALDGTTGFAGTANVDTSHALLDLTLRLADADNRQVQQLAAAFAQTLSQAAVRFPAEPVGVGARWSWSSEHRNNVGVLFAQESTATLQESSPDRLRIAIESTSRGERQVLSGPPVPEGTVLDVTQAEGSSSAELTFAVGELLPTGATVEASWALQLVSDRAGVADAVSLLQNMSLSLASR